MDTHHWRHRWFYTGCCPCWSLYLPLVGWPGSDRSCRCWFWHGHTCCSAVWRQDRPLRKSSSAIIIQNLIKFLARSLKPEMGPSGLDGSPVRRRDPQRNCRPARCRGHSHCWPRSFSWRTGTARPSEMQATPAATDHFRSAQIQHVIHKKVIKTSLLLTILPCAFDKRSLHCLTMSPQHWSFQWWLKEAENTRQWSYLNHKNLF